MRGGERETLLTAQNEARGEVGWESLASSSLAISQELLLIGGGLSHPGLGPGVSLSVRAEQYRLPLLRCSYHFSHFACGAYCGRNFNFIPSLLVITDVWRSQHVPFSLAFCESYQLRGPLGFNWLAQCTVHFQHFELVVQHYGRDYRACLYAVLVVL